MVVLKGNVYDQIRLPVVRSFHDPDRAAQLDGDEFSIPWFPLGSAVLAQYCPALRSRRRRVHRDHVRHSSVG